MTRRKKLEPQNAALPPQPVAELPAGYVVFLEDLKVRVREAQMKASLAVNRELLVLYWQIGGMIAEHQRELGWGRAVVDRLSTDLRRAFPAIQGFSPSNLWRMRAFHQAWSEADTADATSNSNGSEVLAQAVRELPEEVLGLPWGHNVTLVERVKGAADRRWYAAQAIQHGWSRAVLIHQIETRLLERQGKALHNFERTLPLPQSDLAEQSLKDPYVFDFLTLATGARERELEQGLIDHVQKFLVELGVGFAFVGRQVHLQVGTQDFYIDLLFYHLKLRCFVVLELKAVPFEPEFAGKMNFYLSAVDAQMRHPQDAPSIGLLLCKSKDRLVVEYALRDVNKPIGVAEWETRLMASLPDELKGSLPTVEELERELTDEALETSAEGRGDG